MAKVKTSKRQSKSSKNIKPVKLKKGAKVKPYSPTKMLANEKFIGQVILECLKDNDPEGVIEALETYLEAVNKLRFASEAQVPRSTLYYLSKNKNPTLKTLAKTVHAITACA